MNVSPGGATLQELCVTPLGFHYRTIHFHTRVNTRACDIPPPPPLGVGDIALRIGSSLSQNCFINAHDRLRMRHAKTDAARHLPTAVPEAFIYYSSVCITLHPIGILSSSNNSIRDSGQMKVPVGATLESQPSVNEGLEQSNIV